MLDVLTAENQQLRSNGDLLSVVTSKEMVADPLHSGGAPEYVGFEARAGGEGGGDILSFMGVKVIRCGKHSFYVLTF